jgi:hypothetical protein
MRSMMRRLKLLQAELAAIDLWDCLLAQNDRPSQMEIDASKARFFRRVQVIVELFDLSLGYLDCKGRDMTIN